MPKSEASIEEGVQLSPSQVISPMYARPEHCAHLVDAVGNDDRPLLLCEYSHAMGNSNGGLADYWALFREHAHVQGGFIWDWCGH